jgi:hypothetical protein
MANTEEITQAKAEITDLIDDYGNTLTIRSEGTVTQDEWGQPVPSAQVDVVTVGVTDNYFTTSIALVSAGRLKEGESIVILKGDETVDKTYTLLLNSVEYNIINIEDLEAADVLVARILTVGSK